MATRIENIILRARDTLADPNKERWSTERLLRLVDEGQKDIAKQSRILKGTYEVLLIVGVSEYPLPDNIWRITRATVNGHFIGINSHDQMDEQASKQVINDIYNRPYNSSINGPTSSYSNFGDNLRRLNWEEVTGSEVESIIYDNRNLNTIKVYPIPDDSLVDNTYTLENPDGPISFVGDEVFGVAVTIDDYTYTGLEGCITGLFDPAIEEEIFNSVEGCVTAITESAGTVKIWYIRIPSDVTTVEADLEVTSMFDIALKHYVIAHAFLDDLDTVWQQRGATALVFYEKELDIARATDANDGTRSPTTFKTSYRNAFE